MSDKPIFFNGPMVRALLEGRKTQTRRIIKPQPYSVNDTHWNRSGCVGGQIMLNEDFLASCPYGQTGGVLWVRENCQYGNQLEGCNETVLYAADYDREVSWRWKPSIHMHRWANRITLEIKDIRVERLQDINDEDAQAEAADRITPPDCSGDRVDFYRPAFATLWEKINGPDSWKLNPWVWVVSFDVHPINIDDFIAAKDAA